MNEFYWFTVLGNMKMASILLVVISLASVFFYWIAYLDEFLEGSKRYLKVALATAFVSSLFAIFIPTTEQLYLIYGLGGTMDYIKENDTAKQLPEKVIIALDKYLDSIADDKKEE